MHPLAQAILAAAASLAAGFLASALSRLRHPWWLVAWLLPLLLVLLIVGVRRMPATLGFTPPFSWVGAGRGAVALLGPAAAMLMVLPLSRLRRNSERCLILLFLTLFVAYANVYPFVSPALVRRRLESTRTRIDPDGICLQTTPFTCGPAAAVTALRRMGVQADEGQLAILARTCPAAGTTPGTLLDALQERYGPLGLRFEYRPYRTLQVPPDGVLLAVINLSFFIDHFVTVLEVTDSQVVLGDPLQGRVVMPRAEFERQWRHTGILVQRRK